MICIYTYRNEINAATSVLKYSKVIYIKAILKTTSFFLLSERIKCDTNVILLPVDISFSL